MLSINESTHGQALGSASVAKSAEMAERSRAEGVYHVSCVGPREEDRAAYIAVRDKIAALSKTSFNRLLNKRWLKTLQAKLDAFPLEPKWDEVVENVVTTVGKNLALDTYLAGSAYTVVGPYMGLINTNASAAVIGDTMASHAGWLEVGSANAPAYTGPRKTCAWSAAGSGSKALSAALSFAITSSGTVGGCFIVFGTGAVSTIDNTSGTLYSAGAFTGGSKTVANSDTLSVSYSTSL